MAEEEQQKNAKEKQADKVKKTQEPAVKVKKTHDAEKPVEETEDRKGFTHKVRLAGVILDGELLVSQALARIKGIGKQTSRSVMLKLDMKRDIKLGNLKEEQITEIETFLSNANKHLPAWMLNHQKDHYTGEDNHLIEAELEIAKREDINLQKKMRSYVGVRHSLNLPVRGQRTRSSFRHGSTVGVSRKKRG